MIFFKLTTFIVDRFTQGILITDLVLYFAKRINFKTTNKNDNINAHAGNNGSQPMRVSEGFRASAHAGGHLCWQIGTQTRNPALAVAANVVAH
jgi:hypothetical protein